MNRFEGNWDTVYFQSDDEFTDFCLAPYAVVKDSGNGNMLVYGEYSDLYKQYVAEGKRFVIRNKNSLVFKRQCVSKRLPLRLPDFPSYHREVLVQMPVENLDEYDG